MNPELQQCLLFPLLGLMSAAGFVFPRDVESSFLECMFLGGLFPLSFGCFFYQIFEHERKNLLVHGFLYWLFYFVGALYWLAYPLTIDWRTHGVLIPFALIAVPTYLSVPLLLPIYFTKKYFSNIWGASVFFAISNFGVIYFYGHYAPGFPWALPGYVWSSNIIFMQTLSIWGIYGLTFFTLLMGSIVGVGLYLGKRQSTTAMLSGIIFITLFLFLLLFGFNRLVDSAFMANTPYKVRCVQGSIPQKDKMDRNLASSNLNLYLNLSKTKSCYENWNPDFVIWPEASVPYLFTDKSTVLAQKLATVIPRDGYLLAGVVRKDSVNGDIYNGVVILDKSGKSVVNYDKKHLVPFGEYIPFRRFIPKIFAPIANSIGDFSVGKKSNIIKLNGLKIALAICYEAIFPGEFISEDVDVIVNITNDAWFGHTSELVQHLNIVRARAIEEGVPLIRVTNFGISAVFDAYGRKINMLNTDEVGVIDCYVPKKIEKTFYRKFFMD